MKFFTLNPVSDKIERCAKIALFLALSLNVVGAVKGYRQWKGFTYTDYLTRSGDCYQHLPIAEADAIAESDAIAAGAKPNYIPLPKETAPDSDVNPKAFHAYVNKWVDLIGSAPLIPGTKFGDIEVYLLNRDKTKVMDAFLAQDKIRTYVVHGKETTKHTFWRKNGEKVDWKGEFYVRAYISCTTDGKMIKN